MKRQNKKEGKKRKRSVGKISQETVDLLIENSITLQKTLTDLAVNVDKLSKEVAEMLNLFREASKAFTEGKRPAGPAKPTELMEPTKELKEKLDILIDQSKTIAKGLMLLESYIKEKISLEEEPKPKPLPQFRF